MSVQRTIWQYWETRGTKPAFLDGLHAIAKRNAGVPITLVTPQTLADYLPDLEPDVLRIETLVHKADMIRTRLLQRYGGMWLDCDAVVLGDLNWMFDQLEHREFIGFNDNRRLGRGRPFVRVNCFLSRLNGTVIDEWVRRQGAKLPQTAFRWSEIGAAMLNRICLERREHVTVLPFDRICPVPFREVERFFARDKVLAEKILRDCPVAFISHRSADNVELPIACQTVEEIAATDCVLAHILRKAMEGQSTQALPILAPGFEAADSPPKQAGGNVLTVDTAYGPMLAFRNDYITKQIHKYGAHTRTEIAFLLSILKPGDGVFDLGAHIGTYSIPVAQKIGTEGKLLAVEAARAHVRVLRRNFALAKIEDRAAAVRAAIGRSGAQYTANKQVRNSGGTYFTEAEESADSVRALSIDDLVRKHFVPRVIKMDIEGGEFAALAATSLLGGARPIVYSEVNDKMLRAHGASIVDMEALFRGHGYRLFCNIGERHAAHDDFVVAELAALPTDLNNFDVLAVHDSDDRLAALVKAAAAQAR